jgi:hypothetical protein
MLGTFCTALFLAAISVYVFHDVDQDRIGHWNEAFADLSIEMVLFSLLVSGGVWLLTMLGQRVFHLRGYFPRARVGLSLGIATALLQYPFEFLGRMLLPKFADPVLSVYLIAAIILCTAVLLHDASNQRNLQKASEPQATHLSS